MNMENFSEELQAVAHRSGAHSVACIRLDNPLLRTRIEEANIRVASWLKAGRHGEMAYLERMFADKSNPWETFSFARSVVVVTFVNCWGNEAVTHPFPAPEKGAPVGYISAYTRGADYHYVGQSILGELEAWIGGGIETEIAVDTKAVYERLFAEVGGLGEIGGNNLLRVPGLNTRVFIGCLFVGADLPEVTLDSRMPFACSTCQACIQNCSTGAIGQDGGINAQKCISYLSIEKRGLLNRAEAEMLGDWLFGCDDCTTVCPPRDTVDTRIAVDLEWLLKSPASEIRRAIKGNAVAYAGVTQLRKNAVVILKKTNTSRAQELLDWVYKNTGSDLVRRQIDSE
jgi:epoxyqueuosine reductase